MTTEREKMLQVENERLRLELEHKQRAENSLVLQEIKTLRKLTEDQNEILDNIHVVLNGHPNSPEKGMVVRLDRLEQKDKNRTWRERSVIIVLIGLIVKAFWFLIKGS